MKKAFTLIRKPWQAFTLVELLVGITIVIIVFSIGFVSYREFSRRQELSGLNKETISNLRKIQQLSLSGEKPANQTCSRLFGYTFTLDSNTGYTLSANCQEGTILIKTITLSNSTISATFSSTRFKVLGSGTDLTGANTITLTSTKTGNTSVITIGQGGDIK